MPDPTAQTATAPASTQAPASSPLGGPLFFPLMIAMFGVFYFLTIRPQKKQEKERRALLDGLQKNDQVLTVGGIYGTVAAVNGDEITLKIDDNKDVRVRISRGAVQTVVKGSGGKP